MADLDLTESVEPKSDQINADTLIPGRITVTIKTVRAGSKEQPFDFLLEETPLAYRPSKSMRRVIIAAWGPKTSAYTGRRMTLYREPSIMWAGQKVGGIRIAAMSDISEPLQVAFQVTKGKSETVTVKPLPNLALDAAPEPARSEPNRDDGPGGEVAASSASSGSEASEASPEPLLDAITRQIAEITADGGGAHLKTWWSSIGIGSSKRALIDRFGEDARDIRKLMGESS